MLVTGGTGFVGRHLVEALVPENEVRVLDDESTGDIARVRATLGYEPGVDLADGLADLLAAVDH